MSFLRTHSGGIWGSAKQKASVKKAADASAAKRRKYNTSDTTSGGRLKHTAPSRAIAEDAEDYYNKPATLPTASKPKKPPSEWAQYLASKGIKINDPSSAHITESSHPDLYAGFADWRKKKSKAR